MKEICFENKEKIFTKECDKKINQTPVLVLCGGKGTRLSEITNNEIPKSLVEIGRGITILDHLINGLEEQGFRKFIFCLGIMSDQIVGHLEKKNKKINTEYFYSIEEKPLGTGGAINLAIKTYAIKKPFLLVTSDAIFPYSKIRELVVKHQKEYVLWAVTSNYYNIAISHNSHIVDLETNVLIGNQLTSWINEKRINQFQEKKGNICVLNDSGHGVIDPYFFTKEYSFYMKLNSSSENICWYKDLLPMMAEKSRRNILRQKEPLVYVFDEKEPYVDVGTPERLLFSRNLFNESLSKKNNDK